MREGWKLKPLEELCVILDNKREPITQRDRISGEYPYYGATGILDYVHDYIFDEQLILIGEDGAKWGAGDNSAFIAKGKYWVNNHAHVIRPIRSMVDDNWIVYYLNFSDLLKFVTGLTVPKLNQGKLREIPIPLPPLPEQHRIVAILDEVFDSITRAKDIAERNLRNARELFESYLQNVFANTGEGWERRLLGDVCKISDGTHFSPKNSESGKFMYITAKNIKPYYIDFTNLTYISEEDHRPIFARCPVEKGDVLYIKDGATAGIATINTIEEEFSLLSSVALMKMSKQILNTFLVHYMNSVIGKKNFLGYIDGAAITRLTLIKLKNVVIEFPPLPEQQRIVSEIDALHSEVSKLESIYQQKLTDLEELKKSVLQKAFNGDLITDN